MADDTELRQDLIDAWRTYETPVNWLTARRQEDMAAIALGVFAARCRLLEAERDKAKAEATILSRGVQPITDEMLDAIEEAKQQGREEAAQAIRDAGPFPLIGVDEAIRAARGVSVPETP